MHSSLAVDLAGWPAANTVSNLRRMLGKGWSTAQSGCFPVILNQGDVHKGDVVNERKLERVKFLLIRAREEEAHS